MDEQQNPMTVEQAAMAEPDAPLRGERLTLRYGARQVTHALDVSIPAGKVSVIVGPNACGKSTLLRALARLLPAQGGRVLLHGRDIHRYRSREVARLLGLLPQSPVAPPGICVADLVARGRFPHQSLLRQWSFEDEQAVQEAMRQTQVEELADQPLDALSGGQRQRVWLAMVIAQQTPILLLDEPTTFLDIAHQYDLLELCRQLNRERGRTLVMVLHDLNQAARYADHIIAMKDGAILAAGTPAQVFTPARIEAVFGLRAQVVPDPVTATPMVVPLPPSTTRGA